MYWVMIQNSFCESQVKIFEKYSQLVKNTPAMQETLVQFPDQGFAGGGIGYPLQYSWASIVAQIVKNLPAMWDTCI